jgi:hypothetical protein
MEENNKIIQRPDVGNSPHSFEKSIFAQPTKCKFCSILIWGQKGYICTDCKYTCHKKCLEYVPNMCNLDKEDFKRFNNPLYNGHKNQKKENGEKIITKEKSYISPIKENLKLLSKKGVGTPFNFSHNTHVDFNFNWSGSKDPKEIFELKEEIGKGAYSSVYRAIHRETNFELAVKVVPTKHDMKIILQKEIEILKKCKNKNILSYYGTVVKDYEVWILADYCAVGSVKDLMKITLETLEEDQISQVCNEVLKGLSYLHSNGIIHLDVKAANILLTLDGIVKLADFGVSEQIQRGSMMITANDFIGSPLYMAPEVILKGLHNNKADIWSLGITLIEFAEGRPPNTDVDNIKKLLEVPNRPSPKLKNPKEWSVSFNDILSKILIKEIEKRPTANELLLHPFVQSAKGSEVLKNIIKVCMSIKTKKNQQSNISNK